MLRCYFPKTHVALGGVSDPFLQGRKPGLRGEAVADSHDKRIWDLNPDPGRLWRVLSITDPRGVNIAPSNEIGIGPLGGEQDGGCARARSLGHVLRGVHHPAAEAGSSGSAPSVAAPQERSLPRNRFSALAEARGRAWLSPPPSFEQHLGLIRAVSTRERNGPLVVPTRL